MPMTRRGLMAASAAAPVLMRAGDALAQGIQPRRGGTLTTILQPEPPVLQIGVNNQGPTLIAAPKMFNGLLRFSPTLEPMPELAKSWEVSQDGREYVFRLVDNARFHDGRR
jgi:peptide/nickel transport system substrate-binding protein